MNTHQSQAQRAVPSADAAAEPTAEPAGRPLLSSNVLIHIGLRKAGNNWLRENVFGSDDTDFWVPGDKAVPGRLRVRNPIRKLFMDDMGRLLPDDDFDPEVLRADFASVTVPDGKCAAFAAARLGGHPLSNGFDRRQLCRRVKQVFPNARILIVIREQRSMIMSGYIQNLESGGADSLKQFADGKWESAYPALTSHFLKYDRLIRLYQSEFGPENVLTLPMEMIGSAPKKFIGRICEFSNIPTPKELPFHVKSNARTAYFPYVACRRIVPLIRSSRGNNFGPSLFGRKLGRSVHMALVNGMSRVVPRRLDNWVKDRLREEVEEITQDTYAESNRETEKLIGMSLGEFRYCT
jgi:hypothetical protein